VWGVVKSKGRKGRKGCLLACSLVKMASYVEWCMGRGGAAPRVCWERMGFNNIGVGYRDAAV
jgi:hypothetical protein